MRLFRTDGHHCVTIELEITLEEFVGADFTFWDQLQLQCARENTQISEKLEALALIARRIEGRKDRAQAKADAIKAVAGDASPDPEAPDTKPQSKPN